MRKRIAIIGLGKQNTKDHLIAAQKNKKVSIVAVCDKNKEISNIWGKKLKVPSYTSVEELIKQSTPDAAVVAVPHSAYLPIIKILAKKRIHVLKEKPMAISLDEAREIARLAKKYGIIVTVAVQRKHSKIYQNYLEYSNRIGDIFSIHGEYTLNIPDLSDGWRGSKKQSGGGAVIDMGYHLIDLIIWYFGMPDRISADLGYNNRVNQKYDVEDTAKIQFSYLRDKKRILGSIILSRIYPNKDEGLFIYGTKGAIKIYKDKIDLFDDDRELVESNYIKSNGEDICNQFDNFIDSIDNKLIKDNYKRQLLNMIFIDAIYRADKLGRTIKPFDNKKYADILRKRSK